MYKLELKGILLHSVVENLSNPTVPREAVLLSYAVLYQSRIDGRENQMMVIQALILSAVNHPEDAVVREAAYSCLENNFKWDMVEAGMAELGISKSEDPLLRRLFKERKLDEQLRLGVKNWQELRQYLVFS